jgi:hypothetical protein
MTTEIISDSIYAITGKFKAKVGVGVGGAATKNPAAFAGGGV